LFSAKASKIDKKEALQKENEELEKKTEDVRKQRAEDSKEVATVNVHVKRVVIDVETEHIVTILLRCQFCYYLLISHMCQSSYKPASNISQYMLQLLT
jgi:hypothetical protein